MDKKKTSTNDTEITKRVSRRETTLWLSEDFGRTMDNLNVAVAVVGMDGNLSGWNRVATQLTGYSKVEVVGISMTELMVSRDYQSAANGLVKRGL
jgi:PAS domain S-box-containing protein